MKRLTEIWRQILTLALACVMLLIGTACSSTVVDSGRPENPPVQAGGTNNPYKKGGDSYTENNMSLNPDVSRRLNVSNNSVEQPELARLS
ncbi:MAG: hypothetical protein RIB93_16010 [Coleofasciculus sp. D1-CHI-01]|uniref:DUF6658 family protein n=1 Tax=Coleofasciculus sp. D1-CHI-01 TaxID=3068482 RepID=UPI0032F18AF0